MLIKLQVTYILLYVLIGVLDIVSPCGMFRGLGSIVERFFFSLVTAYEIF